MHNANEIKCLSLEIDINNIVLEKVINPSFSCKQYINYYCFSNSWAILTRTHQK